MEEMNLVVAGGNQLSVYRIEGKQLEFCQTFQLYGTVASLEHVSLGNEQNRARDSLVMSFQEAKLSIVEYNPENHDLKTISMHYFEDDELRDGCVTNHLFPPIVRVDPDSRCIAMLVYGRQIVIIPLDKDEDLDLENELFDSTSDRADSPIRSIDQSNSSPSQSKSIISYDTNDRSTNRRFMGQVVTLKPAPTSFKSPVLPSYRIDLSEETCGEKIDNIVDIEFLHNYNDPTLVILYEPIRTWSGRVAMRQDTFSIVALSMNIHQRLQPIIWTVNNLPFDSLRIMPVPKPIGGLLVVACNELIYLNQSVPPFGMSFNSFSKDGSAFPLHEAKSETGDKIDYINISLDLSQSVFLTHNKILFILKDGDVFLVTLFNDDMRSIKNFNFDRIASTVQPNCLTLCENNLLFIGSHVGDSVLAEIVGNYNVNARSKDSEDDNLDAYDDEDESVHSSEDDEPVNIYEHDQLLSTSSSGLLCYGEITNLCKSLKYDQKNPNIELVMTSGYQKNGSVCIMQRTIKPWIDDTYEMKFCGELWTVKPSKWSGTDNYRLILNLDSSTMVFSTQGELQELKKDQSDFKTDDQTIFAGNIGDGNLTIQVMSNCIQLISNDKAVDSVEIEGSSKICDVCLADPHVIALAENGTMYHIQLSLSPSDLTEGAEQFGLSCQEIAPITNGRVLGMSLYKDFSGLFSCKSPQSHKDGKSLSAKRSNISLNNSDDFDDDDELDYGDTAANYDNGTKKNDNDPTYWLFVVDDRGVLEILSLPDFKQAYLVDNFPSLPSVLTDNAKLFITDLDLTISKTKEILMCSMGKNNKKPLLFIRSELELAVYEAFRFTEVDITNHLKIRFKKISSILLEILIPSGYDLEENQTSLALESNGHEHGNSKSKSSSNSQNHNHHRHKRSRHENLPDLRERFKTRRHWLRQFDNIGGYRGVFLLGCKPHWFVMTDRCELRVHPMDVEGAIYSFSQFGLDNFIYFNEKRELRIAKLSKHLSLDSHWPMKKLYLKETVHFVNYHVDRKVYCVVTSTSSPCLKLMKVGSEPDTMKVEDLERECGYIPPTTEKYKLRLYDSETWAEIPDCEIDFEEWEQVTCVKNVPLVSEGTKSGLKGYIAISTNYCYGEDVPNRGRIWILDFIEVVPEPDRPLTRNKIKKVYCQEQKGPVTTLSHTCGLLMSAVGQKIYLWQLKEEQLDGVAFIDTQIYIHSAASVKNLILISDISKSVSLLRYQQETRTLSMVCRDPKPLEVFSCDFAIDNELLSFIVADSERNITIYVHDPEDEDSHGGTRLIRRADFHLGAHITCFSRIRSRCPTIFKTDPDEAQYFRRKHMTMYCTVDGAVGFLFPIHESTYQQFLALQNEMTLALPHSAGLNPKSWRLMKQARPNLTNPCKNVIDGDLIRRFLMLSVRERNDLVRKIGTTARKMLADIQIIEDSTLYF